MVDSRLTDSEGTLLALVVRAQPITAYQIARVYDRSPVTNYNTSKGKIYPMIRRLTADGLLRAEAMRGDARGTEQLSCTSAGQAAVRNWVMDLRPNHLLLDDPLRTKVQSFDLLTVQERLEWIADAKAGLRSKLQELEAYGRDVTVPFKEAVHSNALNSIRARLDWLDELLIGLVKSKARQKNQ